jgi:hypothetical protein
MHAENCRHQSHIIIAPDTAVIVDDIGWNTNNPKRHVNPDILVVIPHKLDLPSLPLIFGSRRRRLDFFPASAAVSESLRALVKKTPPTGLFSRL